MRAETRRDGTEVFELKPYEKEDLEGAEPEVVRINEGLQGGVSLTLNRDQDGGYAFTMHGREWLGDRWGGVHNVKFEFRASPGAVYTDPAENLAKFFERCAARLRNQP